MLKSKAASQIVNSVLLATMVVLGEEVSVEHAKKAVLADKDFIKRLKAYDGSGITADQMA